MQTQASKQWRKPFTAAALSLIIFTGCEQKDEEKQTINQDDMKKISETMGHYVVDNLKTQNLSLDMESFIKGIQQAKEGQEPPLSKQEFLDLLAEYQKKAFDIKSTENLKLAEDFLEDNQDAQDIVVIEKGKLQYKILEQGNGKTVEDNSTPLIHYEGKFMDGQVFDSTEKRGKPIELSLKSTIPGFRKGMAGMKEGEKRRLFIHPDLGYGDRGRLPPNSLLIFDIKVVEVNKAEPEPAKPEEDKSTKETSMSWLKRWTGS